MTEQSDYRDDKVFKVLSSVNRPIGPTEIAKLINEHWCLCGEYYSSAVISKSIKRLVKNGYIICPKRGKYIAAGAKK
jgi:hypothetical protein